MPTKANSAIGFEICDNKNNMVVIKRVLPGEKTRSKYDKEMSLPKIELQCLDNETIEHFQSIQDIPFSTEYKPIVNVPPVSFISFIRHILKKMNHGKLCIFRRQKV